MGDLTFRGHTAIITYQFERYEDVIDEIQPIVEKHWHETEPELAAKLDVALKHDSYILAQEHKAFFVVTARVDGKIVGYNSSFITPHLHSDMLVGVHDGIYIDPAYRGAKVALKLIVMMEEALVKSGCKLITYHVKLKKDYSKLLNALGYTTEEYVCMKHVGE